MPTHIQQPTIIEAAGNKPKRIEEFVGRVNSRTAAVSVARMVSPAGWVEPGQTPEFDEYTLVLAGTLRVNSKAGSLDVAAGQAVIAHAGEWVQYETPNGAEYASEPPGEQVPLGDIAVCVPAFSMETVHRDP